MFFLIIASILIFESCNHKNETVIEPVNIKKTDEKLSIEEEKKNKNLNQNELEAQDIIKIEGHDIENEKTMGLELLSSKDINFIAIWQPGCGPCKVQLSAFNELAKKYTDVGFIGISISEKSEEIKKEMDDLKLDFLNYRASEQFLKSVEGKISKTPTMLVLDSKGKLLLPMVEGIGGESNSAEGQVKYIESIIEKLKNVE